MPKETPKPNNSSAIESPSQTPYVPKFSLTHRLGGLYIIRRLADGATLMLQGDDATAMSNVLEALDEIAYPVGPFNSFEEQLDYILSEYEDNLTLGSEI